MTPETTHILFVDIPPDIVGSSQTNAPDNLTRSAVALGLASIEVRKKRKRSAKKVKSNKPFVPSPQTLCLKLSPATRLDRANLS